MAKTLGMAGYLAVVMPFEDKVVNLQNVLNETLIGGAFSVGFLLARKDITTEEEETYGKLSSQ